MPQLNPKDLKVYEPKHLKDSKPKHLKDYKPESLLGRSKSPARASADPDKLMANWESVETQEVMA